jgi:hypothetical protein
VAAFASLLPFVNGYLPFTSRLSTSVLQMTTLTFTFRSQYLLLQNRRYCLSLPTGKTYCESTQYHGQSFDDSARDTQHHLQLPTPPSPSMQLSKPAYSEPEAAQRTTCRSTSDTPSNLRRISDCRLLQELELRSYVPASACNCKLRRYHQKNKHSRLEVV